MRSLRLIALGLALAGCKGDAGDRRSKSREFSPPPASVKKLPIQWKLHTSEKCGYGIELPGARREPLSTPEIRDSISFEGVDLGLISLCLNEDLEASDEILDTLVELTKAEYPGTTATSEVIEHQGHRGRALTLQFPADALPKNFKWSGASEMRARFFVVKGRAYQLTAMKRNGADVDEKIEHFFASLRLPAATAQTPPE